MGSARQNPGHLPHGVRGSTRTVRQIINGSEYYSDAHGGRENGMGYNDAHTYYIEVTGGVTEPEIVEMDVAEGSLLPQKAFGVFLLVMAILIPALANGDATADFILLPLALGLLATREKVM